MSDLAFLIDNLPAPALPDGFSEAERQVLLLAIATAKQQARPYSGDFTAPWLLSDFDSVEWVTTNRGREELAEDGTWRNAVTVNWAMRLPNGSNLADPKYRKLLDLNKRIAFLIRSGHICEISAPLVWKAVVSVLMQFTRWTVLHESKFRPENFGFKLVDQFAIDSLFLAIARGGWAEAQQIPQRLLRYFYRNKYGAPCPKHLVKLTYELPPAIRSDIVRWLTDKSYYGRVKQGVYGKKSYLKRERLGEAIGEPVESMRSSLKLGAFLRQFEPELQFGELLVSIYQQTEKPDHKTRTAQDVVSAGSSDKTLLSVASGLTTILSAHRHDSDLLPEPAFISVRKALNQAERLTRQSGHHHFIPVEIGLAYFNHAMRFVHVFGDALVEYYLTVIAKQRNNEGGELGPSGLDETRDNSLGDQFKVKHNGVESPVSIVLGINGFTRTEGGVDFQLLRNQPTLDQALRVLVGACVVCIAIMKPSREHELTHLKRDCLSLGADGYLLRYTMGKSNAREAYQDADRPVPVITAKAIHLLQKLGAGLVPLFDESRKISDNLFYLPKQDGTGARVADASLLNDHLDMFCDYVGLAPDHLGRRWYVRIHEMRKWFLLLLFWSGKYDVLDAARWIAGHTDAAHIYAYIEREFPGEELPKLEAEYAIDRLRALEAAGSNRSATDSGLDALYQAVLTRFQVQSLALVPESEWAGYVVTLREAEGFVLEPHSVHAENDGAEVVGVNVSFVLRETAQ